jgi:hypothetical protein
MGVQPPEAYARLKALPGFSYKEMAWDFELGNKVADGIAHEDYEEWVVHYTAREEHGARRAVVQGGTIPDAKRPLFIDGHSARRS